MVRVFITDLKPTFHFAHNFIFLPTVESSVSRQGNNWQCVLSTSDQFEAFTYPLPISLFPIVKKVGKPQQNEPKES